MARIYIINDLGSSQPWLHSLVVANAEILTKSGINLAPFNPWTRENVPHHCHLWMPQPNDRLFPAWIDAHWRQMGDILGSGRDLLILAQTPWQDAHKYFLEKLTASFPTHSAEMLIIVGNPLLALEQRYREETRSLPEERWNPCVNHYLGYTRLYENAVKYLGAENVHTLVNYSQSAVSETQPDIAERVCAFLGCGKFVADRVALQSALFFRSHDARILINARSVKFNGWPRLDDEAYASILARLDKDREEVSVTPFPLRKKVLELMEDLGRGIHPGLPLPPAPDFLLSERTQDADAPLSSHTAREFAALLPPDMVDVLKTRFAQDRHLLSGDQRIFATALCERELASCERIGDPELPVEVTVLTMTYNHERYIGECLDSVSGQQTDFPVRHVVLDHNSADNTPYIVEEYARTHSSVRPVLLSRRAATENVTGLFLRCRTKYAALCDGDDYFVDPRKLQKQVDFMEQRPHCALCFHPVAVLFESGEQPFRFPRLESLPRRRNFEYYLADLTVGNFIQTNTVLYRWRFASGLPDWFRADLCPGDWYWHLLHAETGRIGLLPETMSVYRRHENAIYKNAFLDTMEHWRDHGLAELCAYEAYDDHFGGRYFRNFSALASSVFAAFFIMAKDEKDPRFLEEATGRFPKFAVEFYRHVNTMCKDALAKRRYIYGRR